METPLIARFQYVAIARQAYSATEPGGLQPGWVMLVGWLAPTEDVTFDVRIVCYARPG